jgi:hypothetical protein
MSECREFVHRHGDRILSNDIQPQMLKPLPPATPAVLNPPASPAFPYQFYENVATFAFKPENADLDPRNAWWLMDAAFLSYSPPETVTLTFGKAPLSATVKCFSGPSSTQCYVSSTNQWIVLVFRGTQVDDFWSSVIDWSVDARILPVPDSHGDLVHAGFLSAIREVWPDIVAYIAGLQSAAARPLWVTGHSLGAAVATIACNLLCTDHADKLGLRGLYTYGSPRVGDRRFGRRITVPTWRFRNNTDVVTHVPLGLVFRHVGRLQFIDAGGVLHRDVPASQELLLQFGATHLSAGEAHSLAELLQLSGPKMPVPGFLADHAPINYAIRVWNSGEVV